MLTPTGGEALFFGPGDAPLFGWLHRPPVGGQPDFGVVICPPIGFDAVCSFRSLRLTAESLAQAGIPTLRFDYPGTGNSSGGPEDADRWAAWVRSVREATNLLRGETGVTRTGLVGLRGGALVAAVAGAADPGVSDLVLWAAPRSGRQFVRELRALSRLANGGTEHPGDLFEAAGFRMTTATADAIATVDATRLDLAGRRVLVIERDDFPADPTWSDALRAAGAAVDLESGPGTGAMLVEPMSATPPCGLIEKVATWFGPAVTRDAGSADRPTSRARAVALVAPGATEESIRFGDGDRLFGIITRPDRPSSRGVVVLNTGAEYHIGPHRSYVGLARRLAELGTPVLRWDLGGLGESGPPAGAANDVSYPAHAQGDIAAAIAAFKDRTGVTSVDLIGVCSGAWHAFVAARDGLDVQGFLAVNPPLYLREGDGYCLDELYAYQEAKRYRRSMLDRSRIRKLLRGQIKLRHFARVMARWVVRSVRQAAPVPEPAGTLIADLRAIDRRGIRAHFTFSASDPGQIYFEMRVNQTMTGQLTGLSWNIVEGADHTFRPLGAQAELKDRMERFVQAGATTAPSQNQRQVSSSPSLSGVTGS